MDTWALSPQLFLHLLLAHRLNRNPLAGWLPWGGGRDG